MNITKVIAITLGSLALSLSAETIAWYHFDDQLGTVKNLGDEYPNAIDPTSHPIKLVSYKQSWGGTFIPMMVTNYLANPLNCYRDGLSGTPIANDTALAHTFDPYDKTDHGGGAFTVTETASQTDLHLQTGTVEWFMKTTAGGHWVTLVSRYGNSSSTTPFDIYTEDNGNLKLSYHYTLEDESGNVSTNKETILLHSSVFNTIRNGQWHHVAFTFDESTHLFKFYVDHHQYASVTYKGSFCYWAGEGWSFSGRINGGMKCGGSWDEIRFSNTVLEPSQMLRFGSTLADKSTILYLPFDGNFESIVNPWQNITGDSYATTRSTLISSGKLSYPAITNHSIAEHGNRKNIIRDNDVSSLNVNNGTGCSSLLSLHEFHLDAYSTSMTIEFFMRGESNNVGKSQHIFVLSNPDETTGRRVVRMERNVDYGSVYCLLDNPTESNGHIDADHKLTMFDGKWHHVALVIQPGTWAGKPTQNTQLWVDYKKPSGGYKSQMGTLTPDGDLVLRLGGQGLEFNELRITKGALTSDKFLRMRGNGGMVVVFD